MTSRREDLADRCKRAWFSEHDGTNVPIGERWLLVADAAIAELDQTIADHPAGRALPGAWSLTTSGPRDHRYELHIIYPGDDGGECLEKGCASADELAHRLRFEANLCAPIPDQPPTLDPDEVIEGAPTWKTPTVSVLPDRWTAFYDGVGVDGVLVDDLAGIEHTAYAMLSAAAKVRLWRQQ